MFPPLLATIVHEHIQTQTSLGGRIIENVTVLRLKLSSLLVIFVFMYIYIYICTYIYICIYIYTHTHIYMMAKRSRNVYTFITNNDT